MVATVTFSSWMICVTHLLREIHWSNPNPDRCLPRAVVLCGIVLSMLTLGNPLPATPEPCAFERTREGSFSADCSARGLVEVPTNLPNDVTSLILNKNSISVLKNHSFIGLPHLQVLSLTRNSLKLVGKCAFCSAPHLKTIALDRNSLSSLPNGAFSTNRKLEIIQLSYNEFTSIPVGAFENLGEVERVILSHNLLQSLDFTGFPPINISLFELTASAVTTMSKTDFKALSMSHINEIQISSITFGKMPDGVFQHLKFVRKMYLPYCAIQNFSMNIFAGMTSLEEMSIPRGGEMKHISGFSPNISLDIPPFKNVTISSHRVKSLPSNVFVGLGDLVFLNLYGCVIANLSNDTFRGLRSLKILDMSGNALSSVNTEIFSHLPELNILKLSRNKFKSLDPSQFLGLNRLTVLDLSGNSINTITRSAWDLPALQTLDLSTNNMISLQYAKTGLFHGLNDLDKLILASNPIKEIGENSFIGLEDLKYLDISDLGILQNLAFCFTFSNKLLSLDLSYSTLRTLVRTLQGLDWLQTLQASHMNLQWNGLFSSNISAFSFTPNLTRLSLKGNNLNGLHSKTFTRLTKLEQLDMRRGRINALHPDIFRDLISLRYLYLDHNTITSISAQHFKNLPSLRGIRLENNQLTGVLEKNVFKHNQKLYFVALSENDLTSVAPLTVLPMKILDISENPLLCTCDLQWFRQYLDKNNASLNNPNKTICAPKSISMFAGKPLLAFTPDQVCGPNIAVYVTTSLLVLTFLVMSWLAYQNRWWLNYKCFHLQLFVVGYDELEDGREHLDYDYDVNVISPDHDELWTKDVFLETLVNNFPQFDRNNRIVCGEDELPLKGFRMDAIDYVIENSFKIIVIVSNASVNDAHFLTQLQMAVEHMNEVQLEKVVMVFREDIPDKQLPYLVRLFLSKNKPYFRWTDDEYGQRLFWEKLEKVLRANKKMNGLLPI